MRLRENNGNVNPLGLCNLDQNMNPVGHAYKLISDGAKHYRLKVPSWAYAHRSSKSHGHAVISNLKRVKVLKPWLQISGPVHVSAKNRHLNATRFQTPFIESHTY
jgi:hypothetical protein